MFSNDSALVAGDPLQPCVLGFHLVTNSSRVELGVGAGGQTSPLEILGRNLPEPSSVASLRWRYVVYPGT